MSKTVYVMLTVLFASLFNGLFNQPAEAVESQSVDTGKVVASLVSSHDRAAPNDIIDIALRTVLDPQWHTYWRNPGDSGEPVQISWSRPDGMTEQGPLQWPLPYTIATGPIINYGFEGEPLFSQAFTIPSDAVSGDVLNIDADVYYLVCKDVCIPEQARLSLSIQVGEPVLDTRWNDAIKAAKADTPKRGTIAGGIQKSGTEVELTFTNLTASANFENAYFFPYDQGVLGHSAKQVVITASDGLALTVPADFLWDNDNIPDTVEGVLSYSVDGLPKGQVVSLAVGQVLDIGTRNVIAVTNTTGETAPPITLLAAIFGAFLGGLILNLMPCVFPVISIKALSIAKTAHGERSAIRKGAWLYTAGVLATFLLLTIALLAFKAGGAEIGWGFQLQSPKLVAALALLMFIIGLNLLGVFEIGTSLQNTGSGLVKAGDNSGLSSFMTGALAVIVATPCTAPFMAGAVGYALSQPAYVTLAVFSALAIGFALPFLLIAYVPGLLSKLPKPGPWMIRFREILAFPMFAAAIWLIWVLSFQAGEAGLLNLLFAMLAFGFAIWLFKRRNLLSKVLGVGALLLALALPLMITPSVSTVSAELKTEAWSTEKVASLRAEGRPVFVDFTAAWCVTCKVNEITVLNKTDVKALFTETNTAFLVADWTNKDDVIARELASHGRSGVPLYLYFTPGQNPVKPVILPQVLTESVLRDVMTGTK